MLKPTINENAINSKLLKVFYFIIGFSLAFVFGLALGSSLIEGLSDLTTRI